MNCSQEVCVKCLLSIETLILNVEVEPNEHVDTDEPIKGQRNERGKGVETEETDRKGKDGTL